MIATLLLTFALTIIFGSTIMAILLAAKRFAKWEIVLFGYIYVSLVFLVVAVLFEKPNTLIFCLVSIIPVILKTIRKGKNKQVVLGLVLFTAAISTLYSSDSYSPNVSESVKYLNYWHSGNNDLLDALCGAKSITPLIGTDAKITISNSKQSEIPFSFSWVCGGDKREYLNDPGRLQYSNLALFSLVSNTYPNMWLFLFQSILNLILFYFASMRFGEVALKLNRKRARVATFLSLGGSFYFSTFINGHIGTMMIAAPLAWLLSNFFRQDPKTKLLSEKILIWMAVLFVSLTYLYVTPFLILFWVISKSRYLSTKFFKGNSLIILVLIIVFLLISSWIYFSESRVNADSRFRSWGSFMTALGPFQYLGIFPPNIMGASSLGDVQEFWSSLGISSNFDFFILFLPILIPVSYWIAKAREKFSRAPINILFSVLVSLPFIFSFTTHDPYFVYKTSYIFQFVVLAYIASGVTCSFLNSKRKHRTAASMISSALALALIFLNLYWNYDSLSKIVTNNQSWGSFSSQIVKLEKSERDNSISALNESPEENISNYLLSLFRGPMTNTNGHALMGLDVKDYFNAKRGSSRITLEPIPNDTLRISPNGIFGIEKYNGEENFRWVAGNKFSRDASRPSHYGMTTDFNEYSIFFERLKSSNSTISYPFCLSIADWISVSQVSLLIRDKSGRAIGKFLISKKKECVDITIPGDVREFSLNSELAGEYPTLFDRRRILYRLWLGGNSSNLMYAEPKNRDTKPEL
jgi:hypothetical protein